MSDSGRTAAPISRHDDGFVSKSVRDSAWRFAFMLSAASILCALAIGVFAYRAAIRVTEGQYQKLYHEKVKLLALAGARVGSDVSDRKLLEDIEHLWRDSGKHAPDEYICLVGSDSRLILHTARPDSVGSYVGDNRVVGNETFPTCSLRELIGSQNEYIGEYTASGGDEQVAAFASIPQRGWVVGVHRSKAALGREVQAGIRFLAVGFLVVCGVLMPMALRLLSGRFRSVLRQQARAEESLHRYKHIVSSSNDVLALIGKDFVYLAVNEAYVKAFGRKYEELIGRKVADIIDKDFYEAVVLPRAKRCLAGEEIRFQEWVEFPVSGPRHMDIAYFPYVDVSGEIQGFVVCGRDVTERKRAEDERRELEAQLRQSQKMDAVGQLAGGIAHDFNNILTAILGYLETSVEGLKEKLGTDEPLLDGLAEVEQGAQRASVLTRQLLAFSRQQISKPHVLDLNRTLDVMSQLLRRLLTEGVELITIPARGLPHVLADESQIEQVVMNLVVNARDAMPDGGTVTLETSHVTIEVADAPPHSPLPPGNYVSLSIRDTGCGIAPSTLERVFEPFFTTKEIGKGTGLGLSMVYGIVKQAGGHIVVRSEIEKGTTFQVYLPAIESAMPARLSAPKVDSAPTGTETILVCEDDESVRDLIAQVLRRAGYTVIVAHEGAHALRLADEYTEPMHLLVTDVIMPDMNGKKLADILRVHLASLKVLFISGYAANVIAQHGVLEAGVEFLEKPFNRDDLLRRVRAVLDKECPTSPAS